ncbi:MAG: ABC transporter permease [Spirochaetia bacterium]|jgi:peptide/nickel transport system permease protein|nr:ABC transporter permease [Spirochaetia bacterium]
MINIKTKLEKRQSSLPPWLVRPAFVVGSVIVVLFILISFFPGVFTHYDPIEVHVAEALQAPGFTHLFGTDEYGRDIYTRILYGARIDLAMGVLGVIIPFIVGGTLGLLAGYYAGILDTVVMRIIDVLMAFPFTILVIVIMSILGAGIQNVFIALWLVGWMSYARLVRSETMKLKNTEFIQAAKVEGFSDMRILLRHLLPNVISSAIVYAASDIVLCMLTGASMSFLGLGVQLPAPEWGAILNEGRSYISYAWWITLFPGLFLAFNGIGFSLLGDSLTDILRRKGH